MRLRTHSSNKRGMSMIEVLAALAVFVVGILTVVRMFPPGFVVVKQSENVTMANRLAQAELERLKGTVSNLPVGILGWNIVNNRVLIDVNPEDMGELSNLRTMPAPPNPYYYSDVNKFRRIYAEATRIPSPITYTIPGTGPGTGPTELSMYVLNFSPIEWSGSQSITIRSGPMRRRSMPESGQSIRSSSDYAIDYDEAKLYVRSYPFQREFVITYSFWARGSGHPELRSVLAATVTVPANTDVVNIPSTTQPHVKTETGFMFIDNGSDSLHRAFDEIGLTTAFDPGNPYQYKVLDAVRGVVGFNPAGYGYEEQTTWGRVALTAYMDYDVLDWHIIREERKIPEAQFISSNSSADLAVRLTLRFIKNSGEPGAAPPIRPATAEYDGSTYDGLSPSLPFSILAIDIRTGEWFNEESRVPSGEWAMVVDYKDGIIKFHQSMAGRTFRIYYRAEGDWALQVFKSYESYRRSYNFKAGSPAPLDHREWWGATVNAGDGMPYFDEKIYFARCYSGMSVALDYTYRIDLGGGKYSEYFNVEGDSYQTSQASGYRATCFIDPRDRTAKLRGVSTDAIQIIRITRVYGVSVGARVIWRDGGRGFNAGQWKRVDLQTYLMRMQD